MSKIYKYRFLIARRFTQISIISLFIAGNIYGIFILKGNISSSIVLDSVVLSDPFALLQMFVAGVSLSSDIIIGAFIVLLFYSLIKPRSFCSWVCPVNIITDSANYLRRKLKIKTLNSVMPLSKNIKYYFIAIILVVSFFLHIAVFELISPISMIYRDIVFSLSLPFGFVLSLFLFDLFVVPNGWCSKLCPLGGFYSLFSKISLVNIRYYENNCTACMKCKDVCPIKHVLFMVAKSDIDENIVKSGDCINCGRCIEVCDDDALSFSILNIKDKK